MHATNQRYCMRSLDIAIQAEEILAVKPGTASDRPGAVLYDARLLFDGHNAKADVLLRSVADALPEAVATCLDAAGAELLPLRQAALLKVRELRLGVLGLGV